MAWIKDQICIVPGCGCWDIEAAHCGERGFGRKADDRTCLPICGELHHRLGRESQHVLGKKFWEHHGLDRDSLIARYNVLYLIVIGQEQ